MANQSRNSRTQGARRSASGAGGSQRRGGSRSGSSRRYQRRRSGPNGNLILGIILAALILVALVVFAMTRPGKGGGDETNASESQKAGKETTTEAPTEAEIIPESDLYIDLSALSGKDQDRLINLSGLTREEALDQALSLYDWKLRVVNTNPDLDGFTMPILASEVDNSGDGTSADSDGTVYEVKVDDPLANITIRPEKEAYAVPDMVKESVEEFIAGIYEDIKAGKVPETGKAESGSESAESESGEEPAETPKAAYALELPDFESEVKDIGGQLAAVWDDAPKNGDITSYDANSDSFVFGGSEDGYAIDGEKTAAAILEALKNKDFGAEVKAPGSVVPASATSSAAKYKTMASFTTNTTANSVRNTNIKLACKEVNGKILRPGEEFSFNGVVGERTEARGFGPAGAYNNGEVVQEVGGGVCQVSSTLFNAVYRAGLTTTYRRSHTFEPSYVTPGMDATVSWGGPDYRFVNSSTHNIGIKASYYNQTVTVSIYGVPVLPEGITWSLESVKVKDLPVPAPIEVETGTPSNGSQGSEWDVYKIVKKDGTQTERTLDHHTAYKGHTPVVLKTVEASTEETSAGETLTPEEIEALGPGYTGGPAGPASGPGGEIAPTTQASSDASSGGSEAGPGGGNAETVVSPGGSTSPATEAAPTAAAPTAAAPTAAAPAETVSGPTAEAVSGPTAEAVSGPTAEAVSGPPAAETEAAAPAAPSNDSAGPGGTAAEVVSPGVVVTPEGGSAGPG